MPESSRYGTRVLYPCIRGVFGRLTAKTLPEPTSR
jgi:hypothetical protein